ncbi:hypothetical protein [Kosakonia oryziphila]|uniref:hypothetical protein n=1 Tax=Kosakonia oryziphila TaxID=1005667 RepID=UPI00142894B7|nr:hypothetical protein [Kosakonia oryziphila]
MATARRASEASHPARPTNTAIPKISFKAALKIHPAAIKNIKTVFFSRSKADSFYS